MNASHVAVILLKLFTDKATYVFFNKQARAYGGENPLKQDMWYAPNVRQHFSVGKSKSLSAGVHQSLPLN